MPKQHHPLPQLESLQEWLSYDPETGLVTWAKNPSRRTVAGQNAGFLHRNGYVYIDLFRRRMLAHRVAWMLHHGTDPGQMQIDHIDGDRTNNRISNLRIATNAENGRNAKLYNTNTSGVKGVTWHAHTRKWLAKIGLNWRTHYVGIFDTVEEAAVAIQEARERLHGEFANDGRFSHLQGTPNGGD